MKAAALISKVDQWARRDERVIGLALCGSHARGNARPDSDIDFCILSRRPEQLIHDRDWIDALAPGARIVDAIEDYGLVQTIRAWFGGTEAELGITDVAWAEPPIDAGTSGVIDDGLRILYDPEGLLQKALATVSKPGPAGSPAA